VRQAIDAIEEVKMALKEYFNEMAPKWDSVMGRPDVIARLREILSVCDVQRGSSVLDVACGTGILTPILLEAVGENGAVTGVDFAPEMIKTASAKNFGANARFLVADVLDLPFADNSFDHIFCNGALPHFPDIADALREMKRVLKVGSRLVICHASSREEINATHRRIGGQVANDLLPTAAELTVLLEENGFKDISCADTPDRFVFMARKSC